MTFVNFITREAAFMCNPITNISGLISDHNIEHESIETAHNESEEVANASPLECVFCDRTYHTIHAENAQ